MIGFYRTHIKRFSVIAAPLYARLGTKLPFRFILNESDLGSFWSARRSYSVTILWWVMTVTILFWSARRRYRDLCGLFIVQIVLLKLYHMASLPGMMRPRLRLFHWTLLQQHTLLA